jgi:hypothetical protein
MMCALTQVRHRDSEPTGVPPLMYALLMARLLSNQRVAGCFGRGTVDCSISIALPLSYATKSQQESNLQPIASEVTAIYATGLNVSYNDASPGNYRVEFRSKCNKEPCKSRRRLRSMLSLLLQGFYPCRSGRRSNSALSPLTALTSAGAGSRLRGLTHRADAVCAGRFY